MALDTYYVGSKIKFRVRFFDKETGLLVDPTTVTIIIKDPALTETSYVYGSSGVVKQAVGIYYYPRIVDQSGRWSYRGVAAGAAEGAAEKSFDVTVSNFTNP